MSSEDQELLARISLLAGQINRHKNQQAGIPASHSAHPPTSYRGHHTSYHPYASRGRGGYRGGKPAPYRNRTLVLNGSGSGTTKTTSSCGVDEAPGDASSSKTRAATPTWVSRTDRHMQLINSTVYEKDAQARTKAIEQTRLQKQKTRDAHERAKLRHHISYLTQSDHNAAAKRSNGSTPEAYRIVVQGIPFALAKNGSKLVKFPGDPNPPSSTPKVAIVGGVKFYRSKNGNLYRHAIIKAHQRSGAVKKINQPCKTFSTTGSCVKGPLCRYIHDPAKVAVCKEFLQKGDCPSGSNCDLSHDLTPKRTPHCLHFAKGNCTNAHCPYTHSPVSLGALVCRSFGIYGYCDKGETCAERHVFECPDFSNTGVCKTKGCKLTHRERASFMRRTNQGGTAGQGDDLDLDLVDASSDESVNSDDIDSDEVDEFVGADPGADADLDFVTQKDYIEF